MPDALLISSDLLGGPAMAVRVAAREAGVSCVEVPADQRSIAEVLKRQRVECGVALLAPDLQRPGLVARHVHRAAPATRLVVIADDVPRVRQSLTRQPLTGTRWTVVPPAGPELAAAVRHAVEGSRRARRLRTRLDRITAQLARPRPSRDDRHRLYLSDRFHRALVGATPDGVFAVDLKYRVVNWNPAAERMFRMPATEVLGRPLDTVLPPSVASPLATALDHVMRGAEQIVSEIAIDGAEAAFEFITVPVHDAERLVAVLCVARDMAWRRSVEQMHEHLRQRDEFLMVLSHELRTPLNAIMGWASLIRHEPADSSKTQRAIQVIERNAQLQMQLVADLLEIARIVSGKSQIHLEPLDVADNLHAAVESLRLVAEGKSVGVTVLDEGGGTIPGDPARFQQIVRNLLANAIKFTPAGGEIQIRVERTASDVLLMVRDNGPGIAPDFLPFVFDRFRQQTSSVPREGLGLGLAVVRHFVELHGGTVTAENNDGPGATFRVRLPVTNAAATV